MLLARSLEPSFYLQLLPGINNLNLPSSYLQLLLVIINENNKPPTSGIMSQIDVTPPLLKYGGGRSLVRTCASLRTHSGCRWRKVVCMGRSEKRLALWSRWSQKNCHHLCSGCFGPTGKFNNLKVNFVIIIVCCGKLNKLRAGPPVAGDDLDQICISFEDCDIYNKMCGEPHSTVILYYTILYYTILYYTILHYTTLYYTVLYYTTLYYTTLYYTTLYYTILYCTILYYTTLYYTVLYYTILQVIKRFHRNQKHVGMM